nr:hypothetical protein [uncultured Rhodoferax sp.]
MRSLVLFMLAMFVAFSANAEVRSEIERRTYSESIQALVYQRDLDALDSAASALVDLKSRAPDGRATLNLFYDALSDGLAVMTQTQPDMNGRQQPWEKVVAMAAAYSQAHPKSLNAALIHSAALQARAWNVRGGGYANTVSPAQHQEFKRLMESARDLLDSKKAVLSANPEWYAKRLLVGLYANESRPNLKRIFEEGVARHPTYEKLFFARMAALDPIWGGTYEAMIDFVKTSEKFRTKADGNPMHVRLFWIAIDQYPFLVDSEEFDWNLIKESMKDVLQKFPADWNAQEFLYMACARVDKPMAVSLLPYIKEEPSLELHGSRLSAFVSCKKWAKDGEPFILRIEGKERALL